MSEYKKIIIDNIDVTNKTISIVVDTMIDTSNGPIKVSRWRCGYAPGESSKIQSDLESQTPESDISEITSIVDIMWTPEVIAAYQSSIVEEEL